MIEFQRLREAQERIRPFLNRTPIFTSRYLNSLTGAQVYLKAELFQKTGSFKPRGAINRVKQLSAEEKKHGIVSVSAGNHAQAVAFAASMEGIPSVVVMPATAPQLKLDATRGYGAEIILHDDMRTIFERTEDVRRERNAFLLHPFADPEVVAGQGTIGIEIFEDLPTVDVVVVGIGGGALIAGIAFALKTLRPSVRVIGVEPEGAQSMKRAWDAGEPVRLERIATVADGLSAPYVSPITLELTQKYVDEIVIVSDDEIISAVKLLLERTKLLVEPAGAASAAALLSGKIRANGKNVCLVLSGGNLDLTRLRDWL